MEYIVKVDNGVFKVIQSQDKINPVDKVFDFIIENYPVEDYPRILEIAAGSGDFSERLAKYGYRVTAMDPKINLKNDNSYNTVIGAFDEYTDISSYDLGIAIHPCGIHKDIIKNFELNEKAMFLMPCYKLTCDNSELDSYENNDEWLKYLETLNPKMKKKDFFKNYYFDLHLETFSNAFYTR